MQKSYDDFLGGETTPFYLFIYFALETTPFVPKGYVAKEKGTSSRPSVGLL